MNRRIAFQLAALFCLFVQAVALEAASPTDRAAPRPGRFGPPGPPDWGQAEVVFVGTLDNVKAGPVGRSLPPVYTHTLGFDVTKVLRGSLQAGKRATCSHVARQMDRPRFPEGKSCVVAAKRAQGSLQAIGLEEADEEKIAEIMTLTSLPLGWTYKPGHPAEVLSPWAGLGKQAWQATSGPKSPAALVCSKTARPALLAGEGVKLTIEPVPPKREVKWTNPDGDGEYKITVTNTTDQALDVPALLSDAQGKILWEASLVVLCQGKAYPCPGFSGVTGAVAAARLEPKASVSTVVNALRLEGPDWPQGGYRIEFQFCVGEKARTHSFYYMTRHHGPIRQQLKAAKKQE